eukprot:m.58589 g.58589  ORF g.58589 m.58589 type:complete len:66 (+) comp11704_c1_seq1:1845-2042(+)
MPDSVASISLGRTAMNQSATGVFVMCLCAMDIRMCECDYVLELNDMCMPSTCARRLQPVGGRGVA